MTLRNTQWYNENESRAYPLAESATSVSDSGDSLPTDLIVDAGILAYSAILPVRLSSAAVTESLISVSFSSPSGGILVGTYARATLVPYRAYPLTPVAGNVSGWIAFGSYAGTNRRRWIFSSADQSGLEVKALRVIEPPQVTGIRKAGNGSAGTASGIVALQAGSGISITQDPDDPERIIYRLSQKTGAKLLGGCARPSDEDTCGVPPVRRINGVTADANGIIRLRFI